MKMLTRLRLINWHRFEDETIEFSRTVLLSGENGAGKSTILDAIQFALTCSKAHFNKAAHEKGKRTLGSYIRCKTGKEDRPYERQGNLSAHIALEFYDEEKSRPFIIGAVMDSASEEKEPAAAWYLMENQLLEDDLFLQGRQVKGISAFRSTNRNVRQFALTAGEARKMILARLGRLEDKFFSLIPKALAFRPIHDIKDFVYSYVLDEKEVNVDALRENVRSYQELERMLQDVRTRIEELEIIRTRKQEVDNFLRIDRNHEYYLARIEEDLLDQLREQAKEEKRHSNGQIRHFRNEADKTRKLRAGREKSILALTMELQGDEEYKAFQELEKRRDGLREQIEEDRIAVEELREAAAEAAEKARSLAEGLPAVYPEGSPQVREEGKLLREYAAALLGMSGMPDLSGLHEALQQIPEIKKKRFADLTQRLAQLRIHIAEETGKLQEVQGRIRSLEEKQLVYSPQVLRLQEEIRRELKQLGRSGNVRILCEQLEITRDEWRNAVEGYLNNQRFYLLTDPEDFDVALSVYDQLRKQKKVYGAGLVNTAKLAEYDEAPEGSLAACVSSKDVWARRFANMVLGRVHCCDSYQELKQYPISITRQCMRYQNHVVSAIRPKTYETPYIGAKAYQVQLAQAREEKALLQESLAGRREEEQAISALLEHLGTAEDVDVKFRLKGLELMRSHEAALSDCMEQLQAVQASRTMMEKQLRLQAMEKDKLELDQTLEEILRSLGESEEKVRRAQARLEELTRQIAVQKAETEGIREGLGEDAESCEKEYLKQSAGREYERYRQNYESARKGNWTRKEKAERQMAEAMRSYKIAHDFGAADTMEGYPEFLAEFEKLKNSRLLEYEEKVQRAKVAAEEEFREQFLSRLQENIRQAQGEFKELNRALRDIRFSSERYEFQFTANRGLRKFYDMIMDDFNVMGGQSLFSGPFNESHREAIEELFDRLALDDENSAQALQEYTDYRTYMDYDIRISFEDGSYMYYSKVSREKSGGETQTPFYITIAASFMQLYRNSIGGDAAGLIMMDEAFNNMDDSRMSGVLSFMNHANLQTIIAAPPEKIQYIAPEVESVLLVLADGERSYVEDFTHEKI